MVFIRFWVTQKIKGVVMRVDIERITYLQDELRKINEVPLKDIEFYKDNEKLIISGELIDVYKFIGLSNTSFITTGYYLDDPEPSIGGCSIGTIIDKSKAIRSIQGPLKPMPYYKAK